MKKAFRFALFTALGASSSGLSLSPAAPQTASLPTMTTGIPKAPLYFIANRGQTDRRALFYAYLGRTMVWLTGEGLIFDSSEPGPGKESARAREVTRLVFKGASPECEVRATEAADHAVSYFYGSGPDEWFTGVPTSLSVLYKNVYDRIDLKIYGSGEEVEYDWIVKPGGDPGRIRMAFEAPGRTFLDDEGDVVIETSNGSARHRRPSACQYDGGRRANVAARFREIARDEFGIEVAAYDPSRELLIDPYTLGYSTYFGGKAYEYTDGIAVSSGGEVFLTGQTLSLDFPEAGATGRPTGTERKDAFVIKFAADGQSLVYSAFFPMKSGGTSDLALEENGAAIIVGGTTSATLPIKNAFQPKHAGGSYDGFIIKLAPSGRSLVFSTYFGGTSIDYVQGVTLDPQGSIIVSGDTDSRDLRMVRPIQDRYAGNRDAFVAKFTKDGQKLAYSSYLGGSDMDQVARVAADKAGAAYVFGTTQSKNFPIQNAFQKVFGGSSDDFAVKIEPDGPRIGYSTYLGGSSYESAEGCAVDASGALVLVGSTSGRFPMKKPIRTVREGEEGFVIKLAPNGRSPVFSTYFGGIGHDYVEDVALDGTGQIWLSGTTMSSNFPVKSPLQKRKNGAADAFLSLLSADGQTLVFSTFLGGKYHEQGGKICLGPESHLFMASHTNSPDFPTVRPFQAQFKGEYDGFLVRLDLPAKQP